MTGVYTGSTVTRTIYLLNYQQQSSVSDNFYLEERKEFIARIQAETKCNRYQAGEAYNKYGSAAIECLKACPQIQLELPIGYGYFLGVSVIYKNDIKYTTCPQLF